MIKLSIRVFPRVMGCSLVLAAALAAGGCNKDITDSDVRSITLVEARQFVGGEGVLLIDTRSDAEFERGHLPGAVNRKLNSVPIGGRKDPSLTGAKHLVVYGRNPSSASARAMARRLISLGYDGVVLYKGGVDAWREAGLPLEGTGDGDGGT